MSASQACPPPTLFIISLLVPASILGTLTRIGVTNLLTFTGTTLEPPVIWAQIVGCAVFGGALQNKAYIEAIVLRGRKGRRAGGHDGNGSKNDLRLGTALYTALTSGYCGSVTTYSTWILDVFLAWANFENIPRSGGKSFLEGLTQTFVTLLASAAALRLGMKLAEKDEPFCLENLIPPSWTVEAEAAPFSDEAHSMGNADAGSSSNGIQHAVDDPNALAESRRRKQRVGAHRLIYIVAALFAIGLLVMLSLLAALYEPTRPTSLALVFSPPGAILRWYLSRYNGKAVRSAVAARQRQRLGASGFPHGTFWANILGVLVLCGTYTVLHVSRSPPEATPQLSKLTCDVVGSGFETGFSGALSTVSTFVAELYTHGAGLDTRKAAVMYGAISYSWSILAAAFLIGVPIGSLHYVNRCQY
ncbi:hypothetical protein OC835_005032 [Tilletia horrida]|nr:hypothetical protein OC835_005032 [Tilletia horrida]KAK0567873.1 hypothetical protein OC844_000074 [Tilletia horrida]